MQEEEFKEGVVNKKLLIIVLVSVFAVLVIAIAGVVVWNKSVSESPEIINESGNLEFPPGSEETGADSGSSSTTPAGRANFTASSSGGGGGGGSGGGSGSSSGSGSGGTTTSCTPNCAGKSCGEDGCGGSCGACEDYNECTIDSCQDNSCIYNSLTEGTPCNFGGGICDSDGNCVECSENDNCYSGRPYCLNQICVECLNDSNCSESEPYCSYTHKCIECRSETDCSGEEICTSTGSCIDSNLITILSLSETSGVNREEEPVTSGVPLSQSLNIMSPDELVVVDGNGAAIPVQYRVLSRWFSSPTDLTKPIKWVLLDFQADVTSNSINEYYLRLKENHIVPETDNRLVIADLGDKYEISTGSAKFRLDKERFNIFDSVLINGSEFILSSEENGAQLNSVRNYASVPVKDPLSTGSIILQGVNTTPSTITENWVLEYTSGGTYDRKFKVTGSVTGYDGEGQQGVSFVSNSGRIVIPANYWRTYTYAKIGDRFTFSTVANHSSGITNKIDSIVLEEEGLLRSVFKINGSFYSGSSQIIDYTARIHFYSGKSYAKIFFTVENNNYCYFGSNVNCMDIGTLNTVYFDELNLDLNTVLSQNNFVLGTENSRVSGGGSVKIYQDSSGNNAWNKYQGASYAPRPNSYVSFKGYKVFRDGSEIFNGNHSSGWLSVNDGAKTVTVAVRDFWQNYPKGLESESGEIKVNLFPKDYSADIALRPGEYKTHEVLFYFDNNVDPDRAEDISKAFNDPLFAVAEPEYYSETKVFHDISPEDEAGYPDYEKGVGYILENPGKTTLLTQIDNLEFYGWQDYGDVPIDYECTRGQLNMKYNFDWGMFLQFVRTGDKKWFDLAVRGSKHVSDIDTLHQPYLPFDKSNFWYKGGVFVHSTHDECGDKNPNRNYNRIISGPYTGAYGMFTRYYFTGDGGAREAAISQADSSILLNQWSNGRGRSYYGTLVELMKGYELTGEQKYLDEIHILINKSFIHDQRAEITLWNNFFEYETSGRYLDLVPEMDDSVRDWMLEAADYTTDYLYIPANETKPVHAYDRIVNQESCVQGGDHYSNWLLLGADGLALAYKYSGRQRYLDIARGFFFTGSANPWYYKSGITYSATKEATNEVNWGPIFMYYDKNGKNDSIAPARINDLNVIFDEVSDEYVLTWTAPGDDGDTGNADRYLVKYANKTIVEKYDCNQLGQNITWYRASYVNRSLVPAPLSPGSSESVRITLPAFDGNYYFAVIAEDEEHNLGELSNIAEIQASSIGGLSSMSIFNKFKDFFKNLFTGDEEEGNLENDGKTISANAVSETPKSTDITNDLNVHPWIVIADWFKRNFGN